MENEIRKAAVKKAYQIFKTHKGTSQAAFEKAWVAVEINFPSIMDPTDVIAEAVQRYNKYAKNS